MPIAASVLARVVVADTLRLLDVSLFVCRDKSPETIDNMYIAGPLDEPGLGG